MPRHGHNTNVNEEDLFVTSVDELMTSLPTIKINLLTAGVFPGCSEVFHLFLSSPTGCPLLKAGIQCLIDNKEILFETLLFHLFLLKMFQSLPSPPLLPGSPPKDPYNYIGSERNSFNNHNAWASPI